MSLHKLRSHYIFFVKALNFFIYDIFYLVINLSCMQQIGDWLYLKKQTFSIFGFKAVSFNLEKKKDFNNINRIIIMIGKLIIIKIKVFNWR